ncbi:hypothetical protein B0H34DRAFT_668360 [Crassisporium funariophilum]|nr:hypothetical protein B0H34DRAFT_668360 [Crassisporium funariophilum]
MSQDSSSLHQGTDPNSPELFKRNIRNVQEQVIQLQTLARRVLSEIQNAYQTGNSPAHTEANITALKQTLQLVVEMMRQTGVGALPLLPPSTASSPPALPTEQKLLADTTKGLQVLYDKLQRSQESAAVAANLLSLENMAKVTR